MLKKIYNNCFLIYILLLFIVFIVDKTFKSNILNPDTYPLAIYLPFFINLIVYSAKNKEKLTFFTAFRFARIIFAGLAIIYSAAEFFIDKIAFVRGAIIIIMLLLVAEMTLESILLKKDIL
ncbi:MAG: hypothetical protein LBS74_05180 [Oscillospiraceae bacterium]|jgi:hypothetical protein|nr:hypothetical protein [Oscillospiraceae bacterium]